jgi:hypothetical protein
MDTFENCSASPFLQYSHENLDASDFSSEEEPEAKHLSIPSSHPAWSYESPKKTSGSFLSVEGPSPDRPPPLITSVPNTDLRVQKRRVSMLVRCSPLKLSFFENWKYQLETNSHLRTLIEQDVLSQRVKPLDKSLLKKCFTVSQVVVYEKILNLLHVVGSETIQETFWSSCKTVEQDDSSFIGVDKSAIRSASGRKNVFPLQDHHSERACIMWLNEAIGDIFERILGGSSPLLKRYVVHINLLTKFSSCRSCAIIFGSEENFSRIPDLFQKEIAKHLKLNIENAPDVTIVHQGLRHYHHETRHKTKEEPPPEFFCSKSFL